MDGRKQQIIFFAIPLSLLPPLTSYHISYSRLLSGTHPPDSQNGDSSLPPTPKEFGLDSPRSPVIPRHLSIPEGTEDDGDTALSSPTSTSLPHAGMGTVTKSEADSESKKSSQTDTETRYATSDESGVDEDDADQSQSPTVPEKRSLVVSISPSEPRSLRTSHSKHSGYP